MRRRLAGDLACFTSGAAVIVAGVALHELGMTALGGGLMVFPALREPPRPPDDRIPRRDLRELSRDESESA